MLRAPQSSPAAQELRKRAEVREQGRRERAAEWFPDWVLRNPRVPWVSRAGDQEKGQARATPGARPLLPRGSAAFPPLNGPAVEAVFQSPLSPGEGVEGSVLQALCSAYSQRHRPPRTSHRTPLWQVVRGASLSDGCQGSLVTSHSPDGPTLCLREDPALNKPDPAAGRGRTPQ